MSLIKVDGVDLPTPTDYQVGIQDLSKAERNAAGTMIIERIATKRKIEVSWSFLTKSQLNTILNQVSPVFFNVVFVDPMGNDNRSGTFYCGDRICGMIDFQNGVPRYKDVKFSLIER
jgi:hypothetical protein